MNEWIRKINIFVPGPPAFLLLVKGMYVVTEFEWTGVARSLLECSVNCCSRKICATFQYNTKTKTCRISSHIPLGPATGYLSEGNSLWWLTSRNATIYGQWTALAMKWNVLRGNNWTSGIATWARNVRTVKSAIHFMIRSGENMFQILSTILGHVILMMRPSELMSIFRQTMCLYNPSSATRQASLSNKVFAAWFANLLILA